MEGMLDCNLRTDLATYDAGHTDLNKMVHSILNLKVNRHPGILQTKQVIMATNRADTLDPALLRPGRLDRKIEFPMPDRRQKRLVFQARRCCDRASSVQHARTSAI